MMRRVSWLVGVALVGLLGLLPGCAPSGGGPPAGAGAVPAPAGSSGAAPASGPSAPGAPAAVTPAAGARPVQPVQVAVTQPGDMSWILFGIAEESGIAAEEGYSIELVAATVNVAIPAIMNGDLGYTAQVGSAMRAAARGLDLRVVAIFKDAPLQSLVVRPHIQRASDLLGQSIGVSTSGATAHLATVAMLEALGVPEERVEWAFLGAQSARFAALEQGLVQGAALVAPLDIQVERDQGYRILVRAADVLKIPFVGLSTSTTRIREKPDEIKALIRIGLRTAALVRDQPDAANEIAARVLKLDDRELVRRSMDQVRAVLTRNGAPDPAGFQGELAEIQKLANLPVVPRPEQVTDFRLLLDVQRELDLPVGAPGT